MSRPAPSATSSRGFWERSETDIAMRMARYLALFHSFHDFTTGGPTFFEKHMIEKQPKTKSVKTIHFEVSMSSVWLCQIFHFHLQLPNRPLTQQSARHLLSFALHLDSSHWDGWLAESFFELASCEVNDNIFLIATPSPSLLASSVSCVIIEFSIVELCHPCFSFVVFVFFFVFFVIFCFFFFFFIIFFFFCFFC